MKKSTIAQAVERLLLKAVTELPPDGVKALEKAAAREREPMAKDQLETILRNVTLARGKKVPMCQDTGTLTFYVRGSAFGKDVEEGILEGVRNATESVPLRPNSVNPLTRENLGNRPIINYEFSETKGNELEIAVIPKGAGCENMSALGMLTPAHGLEGIKKFILRTVAEKGKNACPPVVVGIGIGGTSEEAMKLAKKSFLLDLAEKNPDPEAAKLEKQLLEDINALGLGTMGLGGTTTALAVKVMVRPTHTASLPIAVNLQCWADRKATAYIKGDKIEIR